MRGPMKLYVWNIAPNPRRVLITLKEKGIEVPMEDVGVPDKPILDPAFLEKFGHRRVPVLEIDDGTVIGEAMAICRYFETVQPEPAMMGGDAREIALVEMWERISEHEGLLAVSEAFRNAKRSFTGRPLAGIAQEIGQIPELVERGRLRVGLYYDKLDRRLGESPYLAGERFTVADVTAVCSVDFAKFIEMPIPGSHANLARWHAEVSARPSVAETAF